MFPAIMLSSICGMTSSMSVSAMASARNAGHKDIEEEIERRPASNTVLASGWKRPPVNSCYLPEQ